MRPRCKLRNLPHGSPPARTHKLWPTRPQLIHTRYTEQAHRYIELAFEDGDRLTHARCTTSCKTVQVSAADADSIRSEGESLRDVRAACGQGVRVSCEYEV